jgi:cystathionine beta-lyase
VADNVGLIQQEMRLTPSADGRYSIDLPAFEDAITDETRVFMLCNPQNPTGRVFREDELEAMAEICLRNDIIICADEIHSDLVYPGFKHLPMASLDPEIAASTITLLAPSKTFNLAGLKASAAVIEDKELRQKFERARRGLAGGINALGLTAMQVAYEEGEPWLEALLGYLEKNRAFTYDFVQGKLPGVRMAKPEGTYLAWLDCQEASARFEAKPSDFFLEHARVAMNAGSWFGAGGEGHVRLNFGCPLDMLEQALNRIKASLEEAGVPAGE